jgi:hypothetical protein
MAKKESIWAPTRRAVRAAVALLGHMFLSLLAILGFWLVEQVIGRLWTDQEPMIYGQIPLKWLFHTIDVGIIATFGWCGISEAYRKLRE